MRTILIIGGIILAGATVVAVVMNDRKKDTTLETHQAGDGHDHPSDVPAASSSSTSTNPAHGLPGHRCDLPVGAPLNASGAAAPVQNPPTIKMNPAPAQSPANSTPPSTGVKVNPAHGMPGHRCDIQVGAPLT